MRQSREQLEAEGRGGLTESWVRELEVAWGVELEDGHDPDLAFMSHLWQELRCSYRPACFYGALEVWGCGGCVGTM